jgi:tetratricopeptide (TPR) repeat protein/opacity protein-like surface antigen
MKSIRPRRLHFAVCVIFLAAWLYPCATFAETCEPWIAKAVSVEGNVEVQRAGETRWQSVKLDDTFCPGDTIRVDDRSRADLSLVNQPLLRLDQNTTLTLGGVKEERGSVVELARGAVHFFSRVRRNLEVMTGFVNAGVEGTEGFIRVEEDRTLITIYDGQVLASNAAGSLTLMGGQSAVAIAGAAPVERTVVRPRDAVHWALYYPPVMYVRPGETPKEDLNDPRFLAYRASRLLAVGRVDEADADIQRALILNPNYSDAFALQAIAFVVQNDKEKALGAARKAVETGPTSATAHIALSYAQQAGFDLEGARASVEKAVNLDAYDALAWARLAELWSSFGYLDKGLDAAKKAVELDPNLARTQMVLGFAYLTQVKTTESRSVFAKAIQLDQADPLSRLGLGLAKIRDGDLDAGGREIEIAASLDPNNSIVRSYLGKVYFEKKQTGLDQREYAVAKQLDPNDPTPYFYDAIAKQTTNRPVEALRDYQKAIELNDNRAVYRSKLLLDSDEAARSAAVARVYGDLGFQQRALVEGWSSVNTDPTNFSAHRFLADSYSVRPNHEIARVSELLQSQLLQPINITPIQPGLAESNLFLISAQGPAGLSFNEFNPIFNRNRVAVQGSGLAGENETWSGDGYVSAIYKKFSFSGGYSYFDTDGWRDNSDQTDKIANAFVQVELTSKTSIQGEYRYRDNERGDTELFFFEDDFLPNRRAETDTNTWRLGFRQAFSPSSILIGNFSYQDLDGVDKDIVDPTFSYKFDTDQNAYGGELQYLFRSQYANLVGGGGYFDIDGDEKDTYEFGPPPIFVLEDKISLDFKHSNIYLYSYIKPLENLTVTVGGSGDWQDANDELTKDRDQFNPKVGLTWNPFQDTTLRAAAFRVLKRTLITDQTIEPTQVAGFNQFFDEINTTDYWVYGGAIDQKFSSNIYGGAEYTYRNLNVPFVFFDAATFTDELKNSNWDENIFRAYLFWTPHEWLSLTGEYLYEKLERDKELALGAKDVTTHSVPLGINFFHPTGLSASLKATFVDQDGKFDRKDNAGVFEDGDDTFWLVDAAIRYRFPKRYGFLTVGVTNLFDEDFEYFNSDPDNLRFQPNRFAFVKVTLALP